MLSARFLREHRSIPDPAWLAFGGGLLDLQERLTGTEVIVEGIERLPDHPVLLATNASHKYDVLPFRCAMRRRGIPVVSVAKGKYFRQRPLAFALGKVGVVPIISRGYLIVVDFIGVHGRRPGEAEYRSIRSHLDGAGALPAGEPFDSLRHRSRSILGHAFDPDEASYRGAMHDVYKRSMQETVRLARTGVDHGHHVHIYPEGTVSSRLGSGRGGAVQLATALGLPIVPVGISGCREAFRSAGGVRMRGGRIVLRFGEPWCASDALPAGFRAFDPMHEREFAAPLARATGALMDRLDALLDPDCRRSHDHVHDGSTGVGRFL